VLFFGTPHLGSSKAQLLGHLQRMVSISIPKLMFRTETSLVKALEAGSEILQDINEQFLALTPGLNIVYLWEQERTRVKGLETPTSWNKAVRPLHCTMSSALVLPQITRACVGLRTAETLVSLRLRLNSAGMLKPHQPESEDTTELDMLRIKQDGDVFELVTAIDEKQRARTEMA
jgi:hypothetical protein